MYFVENCNHRNAAAVNQARKSTAPHDTCGAVDMTHDTVSRAAAHLQRLHGHGQVVLLPHALVHLAVLAAAQLVLHGDVCALHLPLVVVGRHAVDGGLVALGRRVVQRCDEAVGHRRVVVHQLGQRVEAALRRHVQLSRSTWGNH